MEAARYFHSMCHVAIGAMPVVILDQLSMHIGELFDLSKIPWDNSPRNIKILNETMAYYRPAMEKGPVRGAPERGRRSHLHLALDLSPVH